LSTLTKAQRQRFIEAAREAGPSEDEAVSDETLRRLIDDQAREERQVERLRGADRLTQFYITLDDMLKSKFWNLQRHARLERAANGHGAFVKRSARRPLNFSLGGNAYLFEKRPNFHVDPILVHRALHRCRASIGVIVPH
jgi:hypothetical protein